MYESLTHDELQATMIRESAGARTHLKLENYEDVVRFLIRDVKGNPIVGEVKTVDMIELAKEVDVVRRGKDKTPPGVVNPEGEFQRLRLVEAEYSGYRLAMEKLAK